MTNLEQLAAALAEDGNDGREYGVKRKAKITEIAAFIEDELKHPESAMAHAEIAMASAESQDRIRGDDVNFEISGFHTKSGNPSPSTV